MPVVQETVSIFDKIKALLPANRVAALATWLVALGAFITAVEGTLPLSWQNTALAVAAVLTKLVVALHFMSGSQKFDAVTAQKEVYIAQASTIPTDQVDTPPDSAEIPDLPDSEVTGVTADPTPGHTLPPQS